MSTLKFNLKAWVALAAGFMLAASLLAGFAGTDVFLPMVGRKPGIAPSQWYTTVWVHNPGTSAASVTFYLLERDKSNLSAPSFNDSVQAGETKIYENAVWTMFAKEVFGAMRAVSTQKVFVSSRVYSQSTGTALKDSVGQDFPGTPASFAIGAGDKAQILGVYQTVPAASSELRYNFGFVETTGNIAMVRVKAWSDAGVQVGSRDYTVREFGQRQLAFKDAFPAISTANARLSVEVYSGSGKVIAYGSGIANTSQDPTTFEMQYRDDLLVAGGSGGLTAVSHDGTLAGDGTAGSPLGIASAGVSQAKLSAAGTPAAGMVLGTDGSGLQWQSSGLTLPFSGTATDNLYPVFSARNSGGSHGVYGVSGSPSAYLPPTGSGVFGDSSAGIGVTAISNASDGVWALSSGATKSGVYGSANNGSGYGVYGANLVLSSSGYLGGVFGAYGNGGSATGVKGESAGANGVAGASSASGGNGVYGTGSASDGFGVSGRNTSNSNWGYLGGSYGVYGEAASADAVYGSSTSGFGVHGSSTLADGLFGESTAASKSGVFARNNNASGYGVYAQGGGTGVYGESSGGAGVYGSSTGSDGVFGESTAASKSGVFARNNNASGYGVYAQGGGTGVYGESSSGVAVRGSSTSGDGVEGSTGASGKSGVWGHSTAGVGVTGMSSQSDGVVGATSSSATGKAGVHGRNTGNGPAVYSEGDLLVTGAVRGTMGDGDGGPFPRPAFDSGWIVATAGADFTLGVGLYLPTSQYNNNNFVVELMTKYYGLASNWGVGGYGASSVLGEQGRPKRGAWYSIMTDNDIRVQVGEDTGDQITHCRIRVWYIK